VEIDDSVARDPRAEAQDLAGGGLEARVLEPSPPAVREEPWHADDPAAPGEVPPGRRLLSPVPGGDLTWDDWLAVNPWHSGWAAARWLGARPRLRRPGPAHAATRLTLHRVAAYAVSPARRRANGKIGLRFTLGGFGTPFFGADEQVRVEGDRLVHQRGGEAGSEPITTLAAASAFAFGGPPDLEWAAQFDIPPAGDLEAPLEVDPAAAADLADWYGFAWSALEELRTDPASSEAGRVQLWPEHFDAAIELLADDRRAAYGASPGDAAVPEPYVYVVPWDSARAGGDGFWNADSFRGAILPLEDFLAAPDQRAAVLDFWRWGRDLLSS
jgi:hypothetical protein